MISEIKTRNFEFRSVPDQVQSFRFFRSVSGNLENHKVEAFCSKKPGRAGEPEWVAQVHKDPANCHHSYGQEVEEVLQMSGSS